MAVKQAGAAAQNPSFGVNSKFKTTSGGCKYARRCFDCRLVECAEVMPVSEQFRLVMAKFGKNGLLQSKSRGVYE